MKLAGIIVARMDSSRLPGKALTDIEGRALISYVIERAKRINALTTLALATTKRTIDNKLAEFAIDAGISVYRGSVDDVALRVIECAREFEAQYFVRLNGDSPFLDPELINASEIKCHDGFDLISNLICRTFP